MSDNRRATRELKHGMKGEVTHIQWDGRAQIAVQIRFAEIECPKNQWVRTRNYNKLKKVAEARREPVSPAKTLVPAPVTP